MLLKISLEPFKLKFSQFNLLQLLEEFRHLFFKKLKKHKNRKKGFSNLKRRQISAPNFHKILINLKKLLKQEHKKTLTL